jgi:hypothetical protein
MTHLSAARLYLLAVGLLLFVQGTIGLIVRAAGRDPHETTRLLSDPLHSTVHVVWGVALLTVFVRRQAGLDRPMLLVFGLFYVGFLAIGLAVHHPFGMDIDGKENAFHAVIGPLALLVWAVGARRRLRRHPSIDDAHAAR